MNRSNGTNPGLRNFSLHAVKEERTLRTRFAFFAITAAGFGTLAAFAVRSPLRADDVPLTGRADQSRAIAPAESSANDAYKKTAKNILAEADRLAATGELQKAAVLARRAAALPVKWQAGERTPQQLLAELPGMPVRKQRYVAALLDAARDDLQIGRLDLARAKSAAAQKVQTAFKFLDSRASQLLTEIDHLSHRSQTATGPAANETLVVRGQAPAESSRTLARTRPRLPSRRLPRPSTSKPRPSDCWPRPARRSTRASTRKPASRR
jgi:hypothetical protein